MPPETMETPPFPGIPTDVPTQPTHVPTAPTSPTDVPTAPTAEHAYLLLYQVPTTAEVYYVLLYVRTETSTRGNENISPGRKIVFHCRKKNGCTRIPTVVHGTRYLLLLL